MQVCLEEKVKKNVEEHLQLYIIHKDHCRYSDYSMVLTILHCPSRNKQRTLLSLWQSGSFKKLASPLETHNLLRCFYSINLIVINSFLSPCSWNHLHKLLQCHSSNKNPKYLHCRKTVCHSHHSHCRINSDGRR